MVFIIPVPFFLDFEWKFDSIFACQLFTYLHCDTSDLDLNIIHLSPAHDFHQSAFIMLNDSEIKANLEEAAGLKFIPLGNNLAWKNRSNCNYLLKTLERLRGTGVCNSRKPHFVDTYKYTKVSVMVAIMKENPVCEREWIGCLTCNNEYMKS